MAVVNFNYPKFKYTIAATGQPGAGYKLFTYEEGTSTKKTTWTSLAKTAANTNPIILDANGEADVWIDGNYKFVLAPPTDTDPPTSAVWTYDAVRSPVDAVTGSEASGGVLPINGSFETDTDADNVPDNWTIAALSGGTIAIDATSSVHGSNSLKFTSVGAGGGSASTDDYYEVEAGKDVSVRFSIISANVDTLNKVEVYWYDSSKVYLSSTAVYNEGAANPTSWTRKYTNATAPASAKFARIILTGVDAGSTTHSTTSFDNIELDTKFSGELDTAIQLDLNNLTATAAELNTMDGITATTAELNTLDGITATVTELNTLDGITATTTELNYTSGVTSAIQTQLNNINTTSNILSKIAGAAVDAIGTYAHAVGAAASPGGTVSGGSLSYVGDPGGSGAYTTTGTLSGTWRCMGYASTAAHATTWLRIS